MVKSHSKMKNVVVDRQRPTFRTIFEKGRKIRKTASFRTMLRVTHHLQFINFRLTEKSLHFPSSCVRWILHHLNFGYFLKNLKRGLKSERFVSVEDIKVSRRFQQRVIKDVTGSYKFVGVSMSVLKDYNLKEIELI